MGEGEEKKASLVLLDFWAVWCGPCKIMEPILNEIESEYRDKLEIQKVNVDEDANQGLVDQYRIMSVPTYILLKDDTVVDSFIGAQPKANITTKIDTILKQS